MKFDHCTNHDAAPTADFAQSQIWGVEGHNDLEIRLFEGFIPVCVRRSNQERRNGHKSLERQEIHIKSLLETSREQTALEFTGHRKWQNHDHS
jgi:hypothetical protein